MWPAILSLESSSRMLRDDYPVNGRTIVNASLLQALRGRLIVSCQAPDGDPFRDSGCIARFAVAAERGGAAGIRTNSADDIAAVRSVTALPVFGIQKRMQADGKILITPTYEDACSLVQAGATVVAVECTVRAQRFGALALVKRIRAELQVPVMADIATLEEAVAAQEAGADMVASTMRGYTDETHSVRVFERSFIAALAARLTIPVLAEGRVQSPEQAVEALAAGAFAVIVGAAITRPEAITSRFADAMRSASSPDNRSVIGIDLGGTNTKAGVVDASGVLRHEWTAPTPAYNREMLLRHIIKTAQRAIDFSGRLGNPAAAIGLATAGWVDRDTGEIVHATGNLPGWTGTPVRRELEVALKIPVAIENDANTLAVAERFFGAGRDVDDFICVTLGTGVGGGCFTGGRLLRGAHSLANAIGHIVIDTAGELCSCGRRGCLESLANAAALLRYAGSGFASAQAVIAAAHAGDPAAQRALRTYAEYLATGLAAILHLLDPAVIILAGGISENNPLLVAALKELLPPLLLPVSARRIQIVASQLGYYGGVYGAAALARERLPQPEA